MALYDYIKIEWSNSCDIGNIYYVDGFLNRMFFEQDLTAPDYNIDQEGNEREGMFIPTSQVYKKRYSFEITCVEAVADILSQLPLHSAVNIYDKDGNLFQVRGADIEVTIEQAGNELIDQTYYPVMSVKVVFSAVMTPLYQCCQNATAVTCDTDVPTIDSITNSSSGEITVVGTAPDYMCCRVKHRPYIEQMPVGVSIGVIYDVFMISSTVGWAVGENGKIIKTTDGWLTYAYQTSGVNKTLTSVFFISSTVGWVAGYMATILYTTNGGTTWTTANTFGGLDMNCIRFYDANTGFICGKTGTIERSTDGGLTWISSTTGVKATEWQDIAFKGSASNIIVVGISDAIYKTTNGGTAWSDISTAVTKDWYGICISGGDTFYICGKLGAIRELDFDTGITVDKGDASITETLYDIAYVDFKKFVVVGDGSGKVHLIDDSGGSVVYTHYLSSYITAKIYGIAYASGEIFISGNGNLLATTTTPFDTGEAEIAAIYDSDGIVQGSLSVSVTYEVKVCTFLPSDTATDCACSAVQLEDIT